MSGRRPRVHAMIGNMRCGIPRRFAPLLAALSVLVLFVPQRATAQERVWPSPQDNSELQTSNDGPLQRRLDKAFPGSFRQGIDLLWDERDGWVSPGVFDWWVRIVDDDGRQKLTWENARSMFRSLMPVRSRAFSTRPGRRICAVVGPSRNLVDSGYGELIDAHNVVIRINRAPTVGFESDVGTKTTHQVMWPKEDLEEWEFHRNAFLLMSPVTAGTADLFHAIRILVEDHLRWEPGRANIIHPEFIKYVDEKWIGGRGESPSTGLIALMFAVHVCDDVNVFGFGADASGRWDHYFEEALHEPVWFHPAEFEARLRRELEEQGILKVFRGSRLDIGLPVLENHAVMEDEEEMPPDR